ncbi:MAG: hypothetical protein AB7T22_05345 [Calditrichaceae bacterium]
MLSEFFRDNPLMREMLDGIPPFIFIVDSDLKIHHANTAAEDRFGSDSLSTKYRRSGEVLNCLNSVNGCGTSENCKYCVVRNSVKESLNGQKIYRKKATIYIDEQKEHQRLDLLITVSPFDFPDNKLCLLTMEDRSEIISLHNIISICANCGDVRNDEDYWESLEQYLRRYGEIQFSHSICPDCRESLYPQLYGVKQESSSE